MQLSAADYRAHLGFPADYTVDGVLIYGTWDLEAEAEQVPALQASLDALGEPYTLTKLNPVQVGHGYELLLGGQRFWFVPVMGTAVLAQYLHIACLLGSRCNLLLGIVGGLSTEIFTGDVIIPTGSTGNDSARYYDRENVTGAYLPDAALTQRLVTLADAAGLKAWQGVTTTCEMMLAETLDDVTWWAQAGFLGVEMEGALTFSLSKHFGVPAAAMFYVADNLVQAETMLDESYTASRDRRAAARAGQYVCGLAALRQQVSLPDTAPVSHHRSR